MVYQQEVDALKSAFRLVLREAQIFEHRFADPATVSAIAAMAQSLIFEEGYKRGYDWRGIHIKVKIVDRHYAYIDPYPLDDHARELVWKAMTE